MAFVMLVIFTFSITPKKYWHDWIGDHTDFYAATTNGSDTVSQAGYDCDTDDLVVSTPFIEPVFDHQVAAGVTFSEHAYYTYEVLLPQVSWPKDSRGPPTV